MTLCYVYKLSIYLDRSMKLRALSKSQNWPTRRLVIFKMKYLCLLEIFTETHLCLTYCLGIN